MIFSRINCIKNINIDNSFDLFIMYVFIDEMFSLSLLIMVLNWEMFGGDWGGDWGVLRNVVFLVGFVLLIKVLFEDIVGINKKKIVKYNKYNMNIFCVMDF